MKNVLLAIVAFISWFPISAFSADIEWLIHHRPPYRVWHEDKTVSGLFIEQATKVFDEAKISFVTKKSTANRTQSMLEQNRGNVCSTGWFKTEKRMAYAKFSKPFYQGNGTGALVRKNHEEVLFHQTFNSLLADENLTVGIRKGWSYGKFFDQLLQRYNTKKVSHNQTNDGSIAMLMAGRFDYLLVSVDTAGFLMGTVPEGKNTLKLLSMEDSPEGELRYIMCAQNVSDKIIAKLNDAIDKLGSIRPQ